MKNRKETLNEEDWFDNQSGIAPQSKAWSESLKKKSDGSIKKDLYNCVVIASNDARIVGCLGSNTITDKAHIFRRFPFPGLETKQKPIDYEKLGRCPMGSDLNALQYALSLPEAEGGYGVKFPKNSLKLALERASKDNPFDPNALRIGPNDWDGRRWKTDASSNTDAIGNLPYKYVYDPVSGLETLMGRGYQPLVSRPLLTPSNVFIVFYYKGSRCEDLPYISYGPFIPHKYGAYYYSDRNSPRRNAKTRELCRSVLVDFLDGREVRDRLRCTGVEYEFPDGYVMKDLPSSMQGASSGSSPLAA